MQGKRKRKYGRATEKNICEASRINYTSATPIKQTKKQQTIKKYTQNDPTTMRK